MEYLKFEVRVPKKNASDWSRKEIAAFIEDTLCSVGGGYSPEDPQWSILRGTKVICGRERR